MSKFYVTLALALLAESIYIASGKGIRVVREVGQIFCVLFIYEGIRLKFSYNCTGQFQIYARSNT